MGRVKQKKTICLAPEREVEVRLECVRLAFECFPEKPTGKELVATALLLQEFVLARSHE
jgi:hypothetical protein